MSKVKAPKYTLTEAQRHMYASEKLTNFRWVAKYLAKYSAYTLTDKDLASADVEFQLADIGTSNPTGLIPTKQLYRTICRNCF